MRIACLTLLAASLALPAPSRAAEDDPLARGRALHDAGDYDGAIALYWRILEDDPSNPLVLYEIAFSTYARGSYADAIPFAEKALKSSKGDRAACYVLLGNAHDELRQFRKAEKLYRKGLKEFPKSAALHYNFGVNLVRQERPADAIAELIENLRIRPAHASGWLALAATARGHGERSHALLAYARFLTLEPESARLKEPASQLWDLLFQGVSRKPGKDAGEQTTVNIVLTVPPKSGAAAETGNDFMIGIVAAGRFTEEWKDKSDAEFFAHAFATVVAILQESSEGRTGDSFWGPHLLAYFKQADDAGHLEAMAYDMRRSLAEPETLAWLDEHADAVAAWRAWSKDRAPR